MTKFLQTKILHFIHNKRAISLVMFAGFAMIGVTLAVTSVNINKNNQIKSALQALADQSALGAQSIPNTDERARACKNFFKQGINSNEVLKDNVTVNTEDVVCIVLPYAGNTTVISAIVKIKSISGSTLGVGDQTIKISASATTEGRQTEVVFALSTQGTMCSDTTGNTDGTISVAEDSTCKKFEIIKESVNNSIIQFSETFDHDILKLGVVPYNYKVKFPDLKQIPPSLTAIENETNFFSEFLNEEPLSEMIPLTNDYGTVKNKVNAMTLTSEAVSWGRADLGMHVAALMLDPASKKFFQNHDVKNWFIDGSEANATLTEHQKYVILMADAANIGCCFTSNPNDNYGNQYLYNYTPYNDHMLKVCEKLKEKKVTIFTIFINNIKLTASVTAMANNLMARCASGEYDGPGKEAVATDNLVCNSKTHCYDVSTNEDIESAFKHITQIISKPRIGS